MICLVLGILKPTYLAQSNGGNLIGESGDDDLREFICLLYASESTIKQKLNL